MPKKSQKSISLRQLPKLDEIKRAFGLVTDYDERHHGFKIVRFNPKEHMLNPHSRTELRQELEARGVELIALESGADIEPVCRVGPDQHDLFPPYPEGSNASGRLPKDKIEELSQDGKAIGFHATNLLQYSLLCSHWVNTDARVHGRFHGKLPFFMSRRLDFEKDGDGLAMYFEHGHKTVELLEGVGVLLDGRMRELSQCGVLLAIDLKGMLEYAASETRDLIHVRSDTVLTPVPPPARFIIPLCAAVAP